MRKRVPKFKYTRSDVESVELINKLPKAHRPIVGRIVWWDGFSQRLVGKRTTAFDHWLVFAPEPEHVWQEVVQSLVKVGYPEDIATRKVRPKFQKPVNKKEVSSAN
jgi:hypothetical protein